MYVSLYLLSLKILGPSITNSVQQKKIHIAGIEPIHPGLPMEGGSYQGYPFKGIFIISTVLHIFRDFSSVKTSFFGCFHPKIITT